MLQSRCFDIPANPLYRSKSQIHEGSEVPFCAERIAGCESSEARVSGCGRPLRSATSASSGPTMVLSEATRGRDHA